MLHLMPHRSGIDTPWHAEHAGRLIDDKQPRVVIQYFNFMVIDATAFRLHIETLKHKSENRLALGHTRRVEMRMVTYLGGR